LVRSIAPSADPFIYAPSLFRRVVARGFRPSVDSFGSSAVSKRGQLLKLILRGARQFDPVPGVTDCQAVIRHCDQSASDTEKPADLNDRKQGMWIVVVYDKIIDPANAFILIVDYDMTREFAHAVSVGNNLHIDVDELHSLRKHLVRTCHDEEA
jgi:hypothetical protein